MSSLRILLGPSSFGTKKSKPLEMLTAAGVEYLQNPYARKLTKSELLELLVGMDGLIAGLELIDREVLEKSGIKVVSRCGSGMSNVDILAAKELGVKVFNTPDGPTRAVAEMTVGCLLTLIRQVSQMDQAMHQGQWDKRVGRQLKGMKALIIGFGRIGQATGELLELLGVEILAFDPALPVGDRRRADSLLLALPMVDVVILHNSGEEEILGADEISALKVGGFILNAARGQAVSEVALVQALESGKVAGAWVDAFIKEPYRGPLSRFPQVILTPHVGSYTMEGRLQMECDTVSNLLQGFKLS